MYVESRMLSPVVIFYCKSKIQYSDEDLCVNQVLLIYRTFTIVFVLKNTPGGLNAEAMGKVV